MKLALKNPLVASASPLTESVDNLRRLEDSGIAAVVLPSLFEEQLTLESVLIDQDLSRGADEFAEAITYLPNLESYNTGPEGYLELIHRAKQAVAIPVIASLNGTTPGGWVRYAREMQQAGADALELNLYALETDSCCSTVSTKPISILRISRPRRIWFSAIPANFHCACIGSRFSMVPSGPALQSQAASTVRKML